MSDQPTHRPNPPALRPTMKLRWGKSNYFVEDAFKVDNFVLQQWWEDASILDASGKPKHGRWVDIPVETV